MGRLKDFMLWLLCFTHLSHLLTFEYRVNWVDHPEGKLGYWFCNLCGRTTDGCIHEPNPPRKNLKGELVPKTVSCNRIRSLSAREVRQELRKKYNGEFY